MGMDVGDGVERRVLSRYGSVNHVFDYGLEVGSQEI